MRASSLLPLLAASIICARAPSPPGNVVDGSDPTARLELVLRPELAASKRDVHC